MFMCVCIYKKSVLKSIYFLRGVSNLNHKRHSFGHFNFTNGINTHYLLWYDNKNNKFLLKRVLNFGGEGKKETETSWITK